MSVVQNRSSGRAPPTLSVCQFSTDDLADYREHVFPRHLRQKLSGWAFTFDQAELWAKAEAVQLFLDCEGGRDCSSAIENATLPQLKAYREFLLPVHLATHSVFSLENIDNWINPTHFSAFTSLSQTQHISPVTHPSIGKLTTSVIKKEPVDESHGIVKFKTAKRLSLHDESNIRPMKKSRPSLDHDVISISSDSEPENFRPARPAPAFTKTPKSRVKQEDTEIAPELERYEPSSSRCVKAASFRSSSPSQEYPVTYDDGMLPPSSSPIKTEYEISSDSEVDTPSNAKGKGRARAKPRVKAKPARRSGEKLTEIKITSRLSVQKVEYLDKIPDVFPVPRVPTAYIIDLSEDSRELKKKNGCDHSIASFIRHENQDSWNGTSGHVTGDTTVYELFGEAETICRKANLNCQGAKACEHFDEEKLEGLERYEPDDTTRKELWKAELDANEVETREPELIMARFYKRVMASKCEKPCDGVPVMRPLSEPPSKAGKKYFIGCSLWSKHDNFSHRYVAIELKIDENQFRTLLANHGQGLGQSIVINDKCPLLLSPRSRKEICPFTHVINGVVVTGKIVYLTPKCNTKLIILEPVNESIRMAVVVVKNPHNHPIHPADKATYEQKAFAVHVIERGGRGGALTPQKIKLAGTTQEMLGGAAWSEKLPGFASNKKFRTLVQDVKTKEHPYGTDWPGLFHEHDQHTALPLDERYIHKVLSDGGIKLAVTMLPAIAESIHSVLYLAIDYTFKRIAGETNEWEIASMLDRYHRRATLASLYCNKANRRAFYLLFKEFFHSVHAVTGKPLQLPTIHGSGNCHAFILDAEAAQMQGLGDLLLELNNPEVSGIVTKDPLVIVQYVTKTCGIHFVRNIEELPKDVPDEVVKRLKGFPGLNNTTDIENWHKFCDESPYEAVRNWYAQKIANPWYLPSVNQFLSLIPENSWRITPDHTNIVETAHAARNAETSINSSVLMAVKDAYRRDKVIAAELRQYENQPGTLPNRWNGTGTREANNAQRRMSQAKKVSERNSNQQNYRDLDLEKNAVAQMKKDSLDRQKDIESRLSAIKTDLRSCSAAHKPELHQEQQSLVAEQQKGLTNRKLWTERRAAIEAAMKALKQGPLKNARAQGNRPRLQATEPPLLPEDFGELSPARPCQGEDSIGWTNMTDATAGPSASTGYALSNEDFGESSMQHLRSEGLTEDNTLTMELTDNSFTDIAADNMVRHGSEYLLHQPRLGLARDATDPTSYKYNRTYQLEASASNGSFDLKPAKSEQSLPSHAANTVTDFDAWSDILELLPVVEGTPDLDALEKFCTEHFEATGS